MLQASGLTPEILGDRIRHAFDKAVEKLEATTIKHFTHAGEVTDEREIIDHTTQLKAVREIRALVASLVPVKNESSPPKVSVSVIVPWGRPKEPINVSKEKLDGR